MNVVSTVQINVVPTVQINVVSTVKMTWDIHLYGWDHIHLPHWFVRLRPHSFAWLRPHSFARLRPHSFLRLRPKRTNECGLNRTSTSENEAENCRKCFLKVVLCNLLCSQQIVLFFGFLTGDFLSLKNLPDLCHLCHVGQSSLSCQSLKQRWHIFKPLSGIDVSHQIFWKFYKNKNKNQTFHAFENSNVYTDGILQVWRTWFTFFLLLAW